MKYAIVGINSLNSNGTLIELEQDSFNKYTGILGERSVIIDTACLLFSNAVEGAYSSFVKIRTYVFVMVARRELCRINLIGHTCSCGEVNCTHLVMLEKAMVDYIDRPTLFDSKTFESVKEVYTILQKYKTEHTPEVISPIDPMLVELREIKKLLTLIYAQLNTPQ